MLVLLLVEKGCVSTYGRLRACHEPVHEDLDLPAGTRPPVSYTCRAYRAHPCAGQPVWSLGSNCVSTHVYSQQAS